MCRLCKPSTQFTENSSRCPDRSTHNRKFFGRDRQRTITGIDWLRCQGHAVASPDRSTGRAGQRRKTPGHETERPCVVLEARVSRRHAHRYGEFPKSPLPSTDRHSRHAKLRLHHFSCRWPHGNGRRIGLSADGLAADETLQRGIQTESTTVP